VNPGDDFVLQNLKQTPISESQVDFLAAATGSYESLFNKQARKYREMELFKRELSEPEYKSLLLQEYTFLKRPIFVLDSNVFVCKNKDTINNLKSRLKITHRHA
jgi:arsenate reductase-like glutaredoxin family protein